MFRSFYSGKLFQSYPFTCPPTLSNLLPPQPPKQNPSWPLFCPRPPLLLPLSSSLSFFLVYFSKFLLLFTSLCDILCIFKLGSMCSRVFNSCYYDYGYYYYRCRCCRHCPCCCNYEASTKLKDEGGKYQGKLRRFRHYCASFRSTMFLYVEHHIYIQHWTRRLNELRNLK